MNFQAASQDLPRVRRECPKGPCPHVACRFHLWTDRVLDRHGAVIDLRESDAFGKVAHTCVLHEAARGGLTLEQVASVYGLSRERVRQIEADALARLRDADPGVLRELLAAVSDIQSDGEPWEDDDHEPLRCDTATDGESEESTTDDTGVPEGTDDPESDDTGSPPWSEPTSTNPRIAAVNQQRIDRANARAAEARPYWCPHCGRTYPGVTLLGTERRGCPNPRCAARAWGDRARDQNRHREGIAPDVIAAIVSEYRPGEHGYRAIAREHGLPLPTVASILRRSSKEAG